MAGNRRVPNASLIDWAKIDLLSWTNTWDETTVTIKSKLWITTISWSNTGDETDATIKSKLGISTISWSNTWDNSANSSALALNQSSPQTITNWQPIRNTLTPSEIVAMDANKKLQSLAVATYPSLTELSYVKWVTSWIQSQLNAIAWGWSYTTVTAKTSWQEYHASSSWGFLNIVWLYAWWWFSNLDIEVVSDSTATPTTVVAKFTHAQQNPWNATISVPILPNYYYKVTVTNFDSSIINFYA